MKALVLAAIAVVAAAPSSAGPLSAVSVSEQLTAVNSKEFNGYVRAKLPDGSFQPETFAFGEGGVLGTLFMNDPTFDTVAFPSIARMIAGPLAGQNYVLTHDPRSTKLLIMVFWGTTIGAVNTTDGAAQDAFNFFNAKLLGFENEAHFLGESSGNTILGHIVREVHAGEMGAIEVNRYYVILRAFDFQTAWKQKKLKMLWETRFSLSERRHDFERDLPEMAQTASLYFGQDSYGLVKMHPVPEGRVHIGEVKSIDDMSDIGDVDSPGTASAIAGDWQGSKPGFPAVLVHVDPAGGSTIENPGQHSVLRAHVSVNSGTVTITVPGWDVVISGTLRGDRITGAISEYGRTSTLTLIKTSGPAGENPGERGSTQGK